MTCHEPLSHVLEGGSSLELQAYDDEKFARPAGIGAREQLDTVDFLMQHNTALWSNDTFVWGGEYRRSKEAFYSSSAFAFANPVTHLDVENLFAQDSFKLLDRLKLTHRRQDKRAALFPAWISCRTVRLAWQATDSNLLWASITPRGAHPIQDRPGTAIAGSPASTRQTFTPKSFTAYEAGYRGQLLPQVSLSVSLYYSQYGRFAHHFLQSGHHCSHSTAQRHLRRQLRRPRSGANMA